MLSKKQLIYECRQLLYSNSETLMDDVYEYTNLELEKKYKKYGYDKVLAALSYVWPIDKALSFFIYRNEKVLLKNKPNTIAVVWKKGYDGGVERVNAELMTLWVEMGFKVVFFSEEESNPLDYPYPDSVKRIVFQTSDIFERLELLEKNCISENVDLLVYHDWANPIFLWECMLLKKIGVPSIMYCHGHFAWCFDLGKEALYQPEIFKICNLVVTLSETNARFYQLCGVNSFVVNNPIPRDIKNLPGMYERNNKHILFLGRISKEKYPMEALKIFKGVHDRIPECILDIVGDGDKLILEEMKKYISENLLDDSVVFHGYKTPEESAEYYKDCYCALFTSKMEGYPMVVLETKAFELPLVMYELPFLSLTRDGLGIITAPPGDINAMINSLISIISDEELYRRKQKEARLSFSNLLSINMMERWEKIIKISCMNTTTDDKSLYNACNISEVDKNIVPALMEKTQKGYDKVLKDNYDYRIGRFFLTIPRLIIRSIRGRKY